MSCYFRNLKDVFSEAGIEITAGNKRQIDQSILRIAGIEYKDCPSTWRKLKEEIMTDGKKRHDFVAKLKDAVK